MNHWHLLLAQADQPESPAPPADSAPADQPAGDSPAQTESTTAQDGSPTGEESPPPKTNLLESFFPIILIMIVIYFFMMRGPRKQRQQHQKMLESLSKNDKVRTIGGIMGTVVDIRDEDIVLKVDESTNTKMRVARSAIGKVYREEEDKEKA